MWDLRGEPASIGATFSRRPCFLVPTASRQLVSLLQGRVRTKTVKRSARTIVERYYSKLTLDFDTNKKVTDEVAICPSKRMRNKIAGFITVSILQPRLV